MKWSSGRFAELEWSAPITNRAQKEKVAGQVAKLVSSGDVVGIGSGSTAFLAVQAIGRRLKEESIVCTAIATSAEMAMTCTAMEIPVTTLQQARPDWSFDGADEVDPNRNLIKGRGGALFQEKLLMASSPKNYIIVDDSKLVTTLGTNFPIPVEVHPLSLHLVEERLYALNASTVMLRRAQGKDGPIITENGNLLLDVKFVEIAGTLERDIKCIPGVIESGLFWGYNVEIITATG